MGPNGGGMPQNFHPRTASHTKEPQFRHEHSMGKKNDYLGPVPKMKTLGLCIEDVSRMFFLNFRTSPIRAWFWGEIGGFYIRESLTFPHFLFYPSSKKLLSWVSTQDEHWYPWNA
jgi:hypothetical protein